MLIFWAWATCVYTQGDYYYYYMKDISIWRKRNMKEQPVSLFFAVSYVTQQSYNAGWKIFAPIFHQVDFLVTFLLK